MPDRPFRPAPVALLLAALGLLVLGCAALPAAAGWSLLGERTVSHRTESDAIAVGPREGAFDRIKLIVRGRAIVLRDLDVTFVDGTRQDVAVRATIPAGGETRAVDLAGRDRRIARVRFVYETLAPGGPPAVVALHGWAGPPGRAPRAPRPPRPRHPRR